MSNKIEIRLCTNAEFAQLLGSKRSIPCHDILSGISWMESFSGARSDHYDTTPTTPDDMAKLEKAVKQNLGWPARPTWYEPQPNIYVPAGSCTFMHHIRIGGGNPGPKYPSRNEQPPWTRWGGHRCNYFRNSIGGAGNGNNIHSRAEANTRAGTPSGNGKQGRAACWEAYFRGIERFGSGGSPAPTTPPESVTSPVLREGDNTHTESIRELQTLLNRHGCTPMLNLDGRHGPLTNAAVRNFQKAKNLTVDGVVGPRTWAALRAIPDCDSNAPISPPEPPPPTVPPPPVPPAQVIRRGDKGAAVTEAQRLLNRHGASPKLSEDGSFGPLTEAAVRAFQTRKKITVDGVVGPVTWRNLLTSS